MSFVNTVWHMMLADFKERSRHFGFLATLFATMIITYFCVPPKDADYVTVSFDYMRGIYNSAWMGATTAISTVTFLSLFGFYLVSKSVQRDYETKVGTLLAASPILKSHYIFSKMFSNFVTLSTIALVTLLTGIALQFIRGESYDFQLIDYIIPYMVVVLPALLIVSSVAILFETIPFLRGAPGYIVYFILYVNYLMSPEVEGVFGIPVMMDSMIHSVVALNPSYNGEFEFGFLLLGNRTLVTFEWSGAEWEAMDVYINLLIVAIAICISFISTLLFDRFQETDRKRKTVSKAGDVESTLAEVKHIHLPKVTEHFQILPVIMIEMKLLVKGRHKLISILILLNMIALLVPYHTAKDFLYPLLWLLPITIWSQLGTRDYVFNTTPYIHSIPKLLTRQLPASFIAGWLLTLLFGVGVFVKFIMLGQWGITMSYLLGSLFITSFALGIGQLTKSNRWFEMSYFFLWYIGPLNGVASLDFMGLSGQIHLSPFLLFSCCILFFTCIAYVSKKTSLVE
jgi:hypothetical protein